MNKVKKYPAYKDSGIEWIGEIPEHWEVRKLKHIYAGFSNGTSANQVSQGKTEYPVTRIETISLGEINYDKVGFIRKIDVLAKYKLLKGDLLISNINSFEKVGNTALYKGERELYHGMNLLRISPSIRVNINYYYFVVKTDIFLHPIKLNCKPAINQVSVPSSKIKNICVPLPPLSEQKKIASFLEKKTGEIDKAIELKQKENELLKERRQVAINQAVTRGLHPDVMYNDSGIDWIGEIPEHWEVRKLKYVSIINPSRNNQLIEKYINSRIVKLPMEKVSEKWEIDQSLMDFTTSLMNGLTYFERNDILLAKITPCFENGKGAYVQDLKTEIGFGTTEFHVVRSKDKKTQLFLSYFFRSYTFMKPATVNMVGTAGQKRVSSYFLSNYKLPLPPLSEQKEIAEYLEELDGKINRLLELNNRAIAKLKEYKQVVIDQAVRGQICLV